VAALKVGALELREVAKGYGAERAVDAVSLCVKAGEFVTILGPSGSGKTTTLAMIAGFLEPDSGLIQLDGVDITQLPSHRRNIGMVFQNYALFPHMTTAENVAFPLQMRGTSRDDIQALVGRALARVHLQGLDDRYPRQLSGGQQQRVALARAFVFGPRLLLMDEPLGALDKRLREALELEIVRLSRELGISVLYVTHDQEEALAMSDRIVIYNKGRIEQIGTAEELYQRPASRFVAEFIGESNIFDGKLDRGAQTVELGGGARIRIDEREIAARREGDQVSVVVRPEHIEISGRDSRIESPGDYVAALEGVLLETTYLGPTVKCIVRLRNGQEIRARLRPDIWHLQTLEPGSNVRVRWRLPHGFPIVLSGEAVVKQASDEVTVRRRAARRVGDGAR
jgi:putative spermidine/putrescine transport system ATP-binding protein